MRKQEVIIYFAVNTCLVLIGVLLILIKIDSIGSSLTAAGVGAYIVFWAIYINKMRSERETELLDSMERFGIDDIRERRLLYSQYTEARKKTNQHFDIMGFGLHTFIEDNAKHLEEWSSQFSIRILVLHPESPNCTQRDYEEGNPAGKLKEDILKISGIIKDLDSPRVRIKWYNAIPVTNILRMDNVMWVGPYFMQERSRNAYTLKLEQRGLLFDQYLSHFERIWNDKKLSAEPT